MLAFRGLKTGLSLFMRSSSTKEGSFSFSVCTTQHDVKYGAEWIGPEKGPFVARKNPLQLLMNRVLS